MQAATIDTAITRELITIPIRAIRESSTNPRRSFDQAALAELQASIETSGIRVPLLVRNRECEEEGDEQFFELVCGARRLQAAILAGLAEVPCIVQEMDDETAREVQIVENLQRAGVDPREEAEAFGELLSRLGSVAAVAARLGKEQAYVAKSLRLLSLTLPSCDALRGQLITIDHALLLARLGVEEQNENLKWALDHNAGSKTLVEKVIEERLAWIAKVAEQNKDHGRRWTTTWEPQSVQRLKDHIADDGGVKLSRAPWGLANDSLLADEPACNDCDKNTKANAPLFGDLAIDDPTCTDGACFQAKTAAFVQIALRMAGADELAKPKVLVPRLSWKSTSVKPSVVPNDILVVIDTPGRCGETANPAKLLKYGQWIDAKPGSCKYVRPGITADWSDSGQRGYMGGSEKLRKPGELIQVCIAVGCKVHKKAYETQQASSVENGKTQQERDAEQAAQEKLEGQIRQVEPKIRMLIFHAILSKLDSARALRLANDADHYGPQIRKSILEWKPETSGEELEALTAFGCAFGRTLEVKAYYMSVGGVKHNREGLWKLAKSVGVNADQVAAKAFHDGLTPSLDCLYPKGVKWPGAASAKKTAAKVSAKAAKKAVAKPVAKKAAKTTLSPAGRKRMVDAFAKKAKKVGSK